MKEVFFVSQFPTISETFILNQITGLIDLGHTVKIFAFNKANDTKIHSDVFKYKLLDITYYFDIPYNKFIRIYKAVKIILENILWHPLTVFKALNFARYKKLAISLRLLFYIEPFLKESFDIIHCHFGPIGIFGAFLKDIGFKAKLITTFHGYDLTSEVKRKSNNIYKHLFENGDLFLPINEYFRNKLIAFGCNKEKIIVHHMGIDLGKFEFKKKAKTGDNKINFLTIGRLVEKKGHKYVINALHRLVEKYNNIQYIITGDGPQRAKLEEFVTELDLNKYIIFKGQVTDEEAIKLYNDSHIFILHSVTANDGEMEGTPVVLMEAQACRLPVISTYHSGIPEVVKNGESGFLVPEKDVDALAEKMGYLINHPELWPEMGRAGRRFVEEKYDIVKLNKRLERIYEALVNSNFSELESL